MSALDQPLSQWERFRARYLGAKPQYRALPKDKHALLTRCIGAIKYMGALAMFIPFLPTMIAFAAFHMGWWAVSQQTVVLLMVCDTGALLLGVALRNLLNTFGVATGAVGVLMSGVFIAADSTYQNLCQKLFNKNFKHYPLKNMLQNMEAWKRRHNALRLHDPSLELELSFCIQNCNPEMIKKVLTWCNGAPSILQYRHLEAVRAQVLPQFKSFSSYTEKLHLFQKQKTARTARKETEELFQVYTVRAQLESAVLGCTPTQRVPPRM